MSQAGADGPHVDLETLADLDEGLVDAAERAAVEEHIASCSTCHDRAGALRTTRALLSTLSTPPMPAEVAARIDAALSSEPVPARRNVVPLGGRRVWWRHPNIAAVAAVVAALGLGAALVVGKVTSSSPRAGEKATGPLAGAASSPQTVKQWQTGRNYTPATIVGLVPSLLTGAPPPLPRAPSVPAPSATTTSSATPPALGQAPVGAGASIDQTELRNPLAAGACARILGGPTSQALAVDYALFNGTAAVIVVIPDPDHPAQYVDAWVVRSACSSAAADLHYYKVPRPR